MQHVMLDVETLGIKHNAVTFQVAALAFNLHNDAVAELSLFIDCAQQIDELGSTTDDSTTNWWKTQPLWPDMQRKMQEESVSLSEFRTQFMAFVRRNSDRYTKFWANGICFDVPKIEHLLQAEFCKFWNIQDFRTMKNVFTGISLPPGDYGAAHDALADCRSQTAHLKAILRYMNGNVG